MPVSNSEIGSLVTPKGRKSWNTENTRAWACVGASATATSRSMSEAETRRIYVPPHEDQVVKMQARRHQDLAKTSESVCSVGTSICNILHRQRRPVFFPGLAAF